MAAALVHNAYGKSQVRLTKVQRRSDRHDLIDWSIDVRLEGDFAAAFTDGDNRQIVATDTMKNVVFALARDHDLAAPETFGLILGRHFLDSYAQVKSAGIYITVQPWQRIEAAGQPQPHAFVAGPPGRQWRLAALTRNRAHGTAGIERLPPGKTADSAFRRATGQVGPCGGALSLGRRGLAGVSPRWGGGGLFLPPPPGFAGEGGG